MRIRSRAKHRVRRKGLGRPFWRLWSGFTLASWGDGMLAGAVPLLAVFVNPNPLAVSSVVAADRVPWLLLALPAGAFADKFSRGPLMAITNVLRAAAIAVGAYVIVGGHIDLAVLIVVVLLNASGRAIYYSSLQAVVPDIVPADALEYSNGVLIGAETGAESLVGPIVGTWFFAIDKALPFFTDAISLVLSCIPLVGFRSKAPKSGASTPSVLEGVRILWDDRRLRYLILMVASLAGLQGMVTGVLVLLATKVWGVGTGAYGLFLAFGAVGGLLGSLAANRLVRRFKSAKTLIIAGVVSGASYLVMAVADRWQLAAPAFAVVSFAASTGAVVSVAMRQRLTPPEAMGRVGAASRGIVWGAAPVGALLAGTLASLAGLRLPLVLAGSLQCIVTLVLARPLLKALGADASVPLRPTR